MTTTELEQVIRECILDMYKKEYTGKMAIEKLNPVGYRIKLGLSMPEKPLVIYAELPDELFITFLKEELRIKRFNLLYYGLLNSVYPYNSICNDKG